MEIALLTVGNELLAGDTVNSNATWLAAELTNRGATVERILAVPDDRETIAEAVSRYSAAFDAVIVTGGIGGTPDDITLEAVGNAFDREMVVDEQALAEVEETVAKFREKRPELDLQIDVEAEASIPAGARPILNDEGLAPGCVLENVYVLPGLPDELKAMFQRIETEFEGDTESRFLYTTAPEGNIVWALDEAQTEFAVSVGCYPDRDAGHNRLKIVGTDSEAIEGAAEWLLTNIEASDTPVSRDWS